MAFMAITKGLGLLFYILLGFKYSVRSFKLGFTYHVCSMLLPLKLLLQDSLLLLLDIDNSQALKANPAPTACNHSVY